MSYVGGPGFELYVPVEMATGIHDALAQAGGDLALTDAGLMSAVSLDDPDIFLWGGEPILRDGRKIGEVTSAGFGGRRRRMLALGYARGDALDNEALRASGFAVDVAGQIVAARLLERPAFPYDKS